MQEIHFKGGDNVTEVFASFCEMIALPFAINIISGIVSGIVSGIISQKITDSYKKRKNDRHKAKGDH